jgi:hypothetical protein
MRDCAVRRLVVGTILKLVVLVLVLLVVLAVVATALWGVWGLLGFIGFFFLGVVLLWKVGGKLVKKAFTAPFAAKGAVLRDASVSVHSVTPAAAPLPAPPDEEDEDADELEDDADTPEYEPERDLVWYHVDLTITPQGQSAPFSHWEPGELVLVSPSAKPGAESLMDDDSDEDDFGEIEEVRIWDGQEWQEDEECKYAGAQRLRLHVGLRPEAREFRLRYYFEIIGDVRVPAPTTLTP